MKTKSKNNKICQEINSTKMKGTYDGIWSGYKVEFISKNKVYCFDTEQGIRGMSHCKIIINDDGEISVETES